MKVLVSDNLAEAGIKILKQTPGIEVDVKVGLSHEELKKIIPEYDAIIIRSATKIDAEIIKEAKKLKVIGRAGVGLDNVDIKAATQKGIVVMNTPGGNAITTAEHTIALMMALSRNIPQADASLKQGKWEKKKFQGRELFNKTLGIIGFGQIGRIVADRAKGLKMKVIAYDPYIKPEVMEKMEVEPVSLDELLRRSDYITIHTPKTKETENLINKETIKKMKKGAMLINCARGGIVNEEDLYEALKSGHLAGAALDVFSKEPPGKIPLMELPNFICTPHLGASTYEAQEKVAVDIANQVILYLLHGTVKNAVNVPSISAELMNILRPYARLMEKMGLLQAQLAESPIEEVRLDYAGTITQYDTAPLTTAFLKGLLTPALKDDVNFVNAPLIAEERGIKVIESKSSTSEDFATLITTHVKMSHGENTVAGTIFGKERPRLVKINDFYVEAIPEGHNLFIHSLDKPGVIGMIGTILGKNGININRMQVGQEPKKQQNVILLSTDVPVSDEVLGELQSQKDVFSVKRIEL